MENLDDLILKAVQTFWGMRKSQLERQMQAGKNDAGSRGAVTGGKHMGGFEEAAIKISADAGIHPDFIHCCKCLELPDYFRPEKKWDLLIVDHEKRNLIAAVEFKALGGPSFGNNFNNRAEEAIGNAADLWTAYREGAFGNKVRPWLGYLYVVEQTQGSTRAVRVKEPHFPVFSEFKGSSYAKRAEIMLQKLVRERHYDAGCLILTERLDPPTVNAPCANLSPHSFFTQFEGHLKTYLAAEKV